MKRNHLLKSIVSVLLVIFVSACSTTKLKNESQIESEAIQQASSASNLEEALSTATQLLNKALKDEIDIYSPLHIERARKSIEDSKQYTQSPPEGLKNAALMSAIAASKYIEQSYKNKKLVETTLSEAVKHLKASKELNAPALLSKEYEEALSLFKEEATRIESGSANEASQNQNIIIDALVLVQVNTLKQSELGSAQDQIKTIEELGAEKFIPSLYIQAKKSLERALNFIETNFRDRKEVKAISKEANLKVAKAYFIAIEANSISNLDEKSLGEYLIQLFEGMHEASALVSSNNVDPASLDDLTSIIINQAKTIQNKEPTVSPTNNVSTSPSSINNHIQEDLSGIGKERSSTDNLPGFDDSTFKVEAELRSDEESFDDEESMSSF